MGIELGNRIKTTTQTFLMPKLVDTILDSNVLATRMLSKAKKWRGRKMEFPIKVSKNQTGTSFAGFDTFSTTATNNRQKLIFPPSFYQITVALPLDELSVNATPEEVLDLASIEVESSSQDMADDIGDLFYGTGTGNSNKDFLGLEAIVDDGTNVTTIGGLSRDDFDTLNSTVTSSGGTLSLAKMRTLYNAVTSGSQKPSIGYCTEAVFGFYEQLLNPQERIAKDVSMMKNGLVGGTGFSGLFYMGMPILADEKCPDGILYFVNEKFLDWYALPIAMTEPIRFKSQIEGNDYSNVPGLGFSWSGWIKPSNSASVIGHVYLGGELISTNFKRHGKLTGITGV